MNETDKTNQCAETSNLGAHAKRLNTLGIHCQNSVLRTTLAGLWIENPEFRKAIENKLGRVIKVRVEQHRHPGLKDLVAG